jgi:hypothetical protein
MSNISSVARVVATSTLGPTGYLEWNTNLSDVLCIKDDVEQVKDILLYQNLMFDIVGLGLGKLGAEYSKLLTGEIDRAEFDTRMNKLKAAAAID